MDIYIDNKAHYKQIGGKRKKPLFLFFNGGLSEEQWHVHPYKGNESWIERERERKTSSLIRKVQKIGDIYLYTPKFYKDRMNQIQDFRISDLDMTKHCKELYKMVRDYNRIFVISHSRGHIIAKFFCKLYEKKIIGYINVDYGEKEILNRDKLGEWRMKYSKIDDNKLSEMIERYRDGDKEAGKNVSEFVEYRQYVQCYENKYDFSNIKMLILNNIYDDTEINIGNSEYVLKTLRAKFDYNKQFENDPNVKSIYYVGKTHYLYFYDDVVDDMIEYIQRTI